MGHVRYFLLIGLICVVSRAAPRGQGKGADAGPTEEAQIRRQRQLWGAAFEAGDVDRIMSFYAPGAETLAFDVLPPLWLEGRDAYKDQWRRFLARFKGAPVVEVKDLKVTVAGDVAFLHGLVRLAGTLADGRPLDLWMRATNGLRKIDGVWLVVHDHVSVPVDIATGRPAMDLKP